MRQTPHSNILAGWREWVRLPGIDVAWIKAKLDTGAQTSSLHAFDPEEFTKDGADWVRFTVRPWQESDLDGHVVELPVHDRRRVKSSNGQVQERVVVRMNLVLIGHEVDAEVTLSNRDQMGFRMLVGREALQQGFVVDSGRSFVGERPPRSIRSRNNGE